MNKIIVTLLLLASVFSCSAPASAQAFYNLEGKPFSYQELVSEPITILFLWATWCPSCRREVEHLTKSNMRLDRVNNVYVNVGEKKSKVKQYVDSRELPPTITGKIILDEKAVLAEKFSVFAIPTFIFLKDGEPTHKSHFLDKELLDSIFK